MKNTTPKAHSPLPREVWETTRDHLWFTYEFGEWFPAADIATFLRTEFGYRRSTPQQYAIKYMAQGVANGDLETRQRVGRWEWRWIVHPQDSAEAA